jgi:uncharacterized protein YdaU (DUF1376 family)
MAELPRMPIDAADLLADTTFMSNEEFGAYMRILLTMWLHKGRIIDNETELAGITHTTEARWRKIAERVRRPLTSAGGELSQKRLTATWLDVQELRRKRSDASGKRWGPKTGPPSDASGYANAYAKPNQMDMQTGMQNASNAYAYQKKKGKSLTSTESVAARARTAETHENQDKTAGSLATALGDGALTRPPVAAQEPNSKPPAEWTREDLERSFRAKRHEEHHE